MRYVIFAPPYRSNSAGIRVLYELHKLLLFSGKDALITSLPFRLEKDDVVILPEGVPYNQFVNDDTFLIRYFLSYPIEGMDYSRDDMSVGYSKKHILSCDCYLYINTTEPFFEERDYKREYNAAYIGKGSYEPIEGIPENTILITGDFPPTRKDMADFLNQCSNVYIFDDNTALGNEAVRCGASAWLVKDGSILPWPEEEIHPPVTYQVRKFLKMVEDIQRGKHHES